MSLFTSLADDPELIERRNRSSRIPDLAYGMILPMAGLGFAGFPAVDLASIPMVVIAFMRRARFRLPTGTLVLLAALLTSLVVSGELNGADLAVRRLGHIGIWAALVVAFGQGRINVMSVARGIGLGILVALPLSLPSLVTGGYAGRLTGLFGDPNTAGMVLVVLGPWAVGITKGRLRVLVGILVAVAIVLTFSRTSLLAFAVLLVWVVVSRRFSVWLAAAVLIPLAALVTPWLESIRLFGPFEARTGSDALRERIAEAAALKLSTTPWYGNGPGTATVQVQNTPFYLHNTYDSLRIEGGWLAFALVAALLLLVFLRAATGPRATRQPWFEASLVAGLVCGLNLGEVLFEVQLAANIGAMLLVGSVQRNATVSDDTATNPLSDDVLTTIRSVDDDAFIADLRRAGAGKAPPAVVETGAPDLSRIVR